MNSILILGSGCKKCHQTHDQVVEILNANNIDIPVTLDTNPQTTMKYGVMRTPAVVIDDKLVHYGSVPTADEIKSWLENK